MTTYYELYGQKVQYLASDPTDVQTGQVWYNSTSAVLKVRQVTTATWASGGTMPSGGIGPGSIGTQTAGLYFTLTIPGQSPSSSILAREYDGTTWTSGGSNPSRIQGSAGSGTQTAGLKFGGYNWNVSPSESTVTINYNGTSWNSNPATLNTARMGLMGSSAGSDTAALAFGGQPPAGNSGLETESYNGTTWTNVNSLVYGAGIYGGGFGTQTAAIACSATPGNPTPAPAGSAQTQSWNGTSWTAVNSMNTGRTRAANFGTQTNGVVSCGTGPTAETEVWNGTTWSISTNNPTARRYLAGCGTGADGLAFGGEGSDTSCQEFTGAAAITKTVTVS
jgi:hypothetical protein